MDNLQFIETNPNTININCNSCSYGVTNIRPTLYVLICIGFEQYFTRVNDLNPNCWLTKKRYNRIAERVHAYKKNVEVKISKSVL